MEPKEEQSGSGLDYGITPYFVYALCRNSWEGGRSYHPSQVADLTPDQMYLLLAKEEHIKAKSRLGSHGKGIKQTETGELLRIGPDGKVPGRDKDGNPIRGRIGGKSKARLLMEAAKEK